MSQKVIILGIESSCDDTSVAISANCMLLSNVVANQEVHKQYGGVVPELASRSHQINIIPVLSQAIKEAGVCVTDIQAVAFTNGPGLLGSLMVGASFAKGISLALNIPLIEINHLQGHILSHFIQESNEEYDIPEFPHLSLVISGGHTQIIQVNDPYNFQILGTTIDDAAGEAFDKAAKLLGFGYPGGPIIDQWASKGDPYKFHFPKPVVSGINFSFSGLKTSLLYFLKDQLNKDKDFIINNLADICASYQRTIVEILIEKIIKATEQTKIKTITLCGGVSANSEVRKQFAKLSESGIKVFLPKIKFTTDNAAMIAIAGYFKYLNKQFSALDVNPYAKIKI
ncbi:MAG: tRNA (adenosine(37)-N6)-threonylcarbamoyltransferase complex transferase subunit TsaD [Bacteroidales bacterium]|nr:tRNA (adenosine(37)-N6)-threonylcarbamoyltransferase complex transferase subunit TsaD [Bacteroidales bacterium]